jgi:class 3 adenylate cyclase/tetratricopeptide (TPR) repeat protein
MTSQTGSAVTTILFTDLVNSTELLQRAGDEAAQVIFQAHHKLLREAVAANGGHEVKWLGDGLMVAFPSAADAVRCAIAMQLASSRSSGAERLGVRVGINVGEALQDESDYFGTAVVANRLCDSAEAGQIICSSLVSGLLAGRQAFRFRDLGALELRGFGEPVAACEAEYEREEQGAFLAQTPFVGRTNETSRLREKLGQTAEGQGGLVMLVGEPGIGKTRTAEEFAEHARGQGSLVLWGRCYEGEWAPPYGPFAEAIAGYVQSADAETIRTDLGYGAPALARLVPALRDALADVEEPAPLQPDEERFRLLDAVAQFLIATSKRSTVVLFLDDLHWADKGTIAMLRHVARFARQERILIVGAYRDIELDRQHPLSEALAQLRREAEYERLLLKGLDTGEVSELLTVIGEQEAQPALVEAISRETDGNPFFIRETLLHLIDTGALYRKDGVWTSAATNIEELGIPEGVRQVIGRRLSRLSDSANRLLTAASAFNGGFRFQTVAAVASLDEDTALDAIDEALDAQIIRPANPEHYDFTHALIRHTLYGEMNPSRQVRLHRTIADVMSERVKEYTLERQASHAAELAYQYHRSAALPGGERGVEFAIQAADQAEATAAWEEAVTFLRIALELLPDADGRRPRLLGRLGMVLAGALEFEDALATASEAGDAIRASEGETAAAGYLADAAWALNGAGSTRGGWTLAEQGLALAGRESEVLWARLAVLDLQKREAENPDDPGIPLDTDERRELRRIANSMPESLEAQQIAGALFVYQVSSRKEALDRLAHSAPASVFVAGNYRGGMKLWLEAAERAEQSGQIALAAADYSQVSRCHSALGELDHAFASYEKASAFAERLPGPSFLALQVVAALDELNYARDDGWEQATQIIAGLMAQQAPENNWASAAIRAGVARTFAFMGQPAAALDLLPELIDPIARAPGGAVNYTRMVCNVVEVLWMTENTGNVSTIEDALRTKIIEPDFRYPGVDGRLAMAQLCALQGRYDEAIDWFAKAREVLDEQDARPLRAIVDYYEAVMHVRRDATGDGQHVTTLLDAALAQFRAISMPGWTRRAEALSVSVAT